VPSVTDPGTTRYQAPSGVSFAKPTGWQVLYPKATVVVYIDKPGVAFRRNITVLHQTEPGPVTLGTYTAASERELAALDDFHQIALTATTLSGYAAVRDVFSARFTQTRSVLRLLSEWTVIDGRPWLVTYTSQQSNYEGALASVERLIASMTLPAGA
jgi:hypothetical protein